MNTLALLGEIQAIARNGLHYTTDPYDHDRYEQLLRLTSREYSEVLQAPETDIRTRLLNDLGQVTPKVGADAAIFDASGRILLMNRSDHSGWGLPGGWVEQGEKPIDAVVREVREETSLRVEVKRLVGVFTRAPSMKNGPHAMISIVHLCEIVEGELRLSHEGSELKYCPIESVENWHANHQRLAGAAYRVRESGYILEAISD